MATLVEDWEGVSVEGNGTGVGVGVWATEDDTKGVVVDEGVEIGLVTGVGV